jgi:hypothetical protein
MAADDSVLMTFTVKSTYELETPIKTLAKLLGMTVRELRACVAGDEDFEPDDTQIAALVKESGGASEDAEFELESMELDPQ